MAKVFSMAELAAWQCDDDTEMPSDSDVWPPLDGSFDDASSDAESYDGGLTALNSAISSMAGKFGAGDADRLGHCPERWPKPLLHQGRPLCVGDRRVAPFLEAGPRLKAIFLDYDGTLREFEARPELATPTAELHSLLAALNSRKDLLVHIISGRDALFLSSQLGCYERFVLIAEHERRVAGRFQVWCPDTEPHASHHAQQHPEPMEDWRACVRLEMSRACDTISDSLIEEKASSLVWHYRGAPNDAKTERAAASLLSRLERLRCVRCFRETKVARGNKTVEFFSRKATKGDVVRRICQSRASLGKPFAAVLVAGDDASDESMFEEAASDTFLSIKVGREDTKADFFVETPAHLHTFLWQLLA